VHNRRGTVTIITFVVSIGTRYYFLVIRSFRGKDAEAIWRRRYVKRLSPELAKLTYNKLVLINAAENINDLRVPPGNRLEKLAGDRAGQHSVRVNDQWRLCFTWSAGGASNVELVDYH
jgi:proteic killer suppression protein